MPSEDLGAKCTRHHRWSGKCECSPGAAVGAPAWGSGDEVDSRCSTNPMRHVRDTAAALHWYEHAKRLGSAWARTRIDDLREAGENSQLATFRGGNAP